MKYSIAYKFSDKEKKLANNDLEKDIKQIKADIGNIDIALTNILGE